MRGTLSLLSQSIDPCRFIPAHAGNTVERGQSSLNRSVHPCACGEHSTSSSVHGRQPGSSPRMRGTRLALRGVACRPWFIPAHAGNTPGRIVSIVRKTVHPRACGEHTPPCFWRLSFAGSSPRMRGTQMLHQLRPERGRFIPAHAGNTSCPSNPLRPGAVHPRACGEHFAQQRQVAFYVGSSPRMRGTLVHQAADLGHQRFIPAHAGNTPTSPRRSETKAVHPRACGEHAFLPGHR